MTVLFWVSLAFIVLAYAGYPLLVILLAHLFGQPVRKGPVAGRVSFVVAAHNEADSITRRIEDLLSQQAVEIAEVLIGSDGSTDRTNVLVSAFKDPRVKLVALPEHLGKPAALNACAALATGDFLVFGDARQTWGPQATARLLENFADPSVSCVSGELVLESSASTTQGVGLYWRYEKLIRKAESSLFSTVGATGAIYAVRRSDWSPLSHDTLLDDVVTPLVARRKWSHIVFEPEALVYDQAVSHQREWTRKVRTLAGNFQLLFSPRRHGNAFRPGTLLQFLGHKVARLVVPAAMLGAFVGTFGFTGVPFAVLLVAQLAGYAAAALGWTLEHFGRPSRLFSLPLTLVTLNLAVVAGFVRYVTGSQQVQWKRTALPENRGTL